MPVLCDIVHHTSKMLSHHLLRHLGCALALNLFRPVIGGGGQWGDRNRGLGQSRYRLKDVYIGDDFFGQWTFETFQDPTHGRVNYVDLGTAITRNLSYGVWFAFH